MLSAPTTNFALVALCCLRAHKSARAGPAEQLDSLISISQNLNSNAFSKIGNVNVIETSDDDSKPIPLCYLPYLHPFTNAADDGIPLNNVGQYEGLAAVLLAMEHLNTGNGDIVPELDGIDQRCPLRYTTEAFDTKYQPATAVNHVISLTEGNAQNLVPCAILGAAYSVASIPTAIISGIRGIPQISPISTSVELDDKSQYKLFGRTIPNDDGTSVPLVAKLSSWNVEHIAVLYVDDSYGSPFAEGIRLAAQNFRPNMQVETVPIAVDAEDEKISDAIQQLKDTQYTYFFAVLFPDSFVNRIMTEAYNKGIAGTGRHTWLFSDSAGSAPTGQEFPIDSPLVKAYQGTGLVKAASSVPGMVDAYDKLARSMQQIGESERDLSFLEDSFPQDYSEEGKFVNHSIVTGREAFLKSPGISAPFLYDATVLIGLASCRLLEASDYFTGTELFHAILNTTFDGTTGSVLLDPETGTREPGSAMFSLTNFIYDRDGDGGQGKVQFKEIETDLFLSGEWELLVPYTFGNGASDAPPDLPALEVTPNYLSTGLKAVGSLLCGIIISMALGFSLWTFCNSERGVVRGSQPIFLHLISAGTLLMGLSIIPLTIDKGIAGQMGANAACMAFPWFIAVGFSLTFSALFTKTNRIVQVMQNAAKFTRVTVTAADVMKPMIALLVLNIIVLSIWTAIDSLKWRTVEVSWDPFGRVQETYGICSSDHESIFVAILFVINLGSVIFALLQAYRARHISTQYQESSYIFLAMTFILLVSFVSLPIMVVARDTVAAEYFSKVGLIFVVCASVLSFIFVPKVRALRAKDRIARLTQEDSSMGIKIMSTPLAQVELEKEIEKLRRENHDLGRKKDIQQAELEKEIRELQRLLPKEKGTDT